VLDKHCDYSDFDFSWEPAPWESHFRHAFASQWQKDSGTYLIPKAGYTETKYNTDNTVVRLPDVTKWDSMESDFDYSWHHDVTEPPYIYQFGTQHQKTGGPRYTVAGAESTKFVGDITSRVRAVAGGAVLIKHLNTPYDANINIINSTRFISNYLDTLKRILKKIDAEYVWVISDLCDYADFDFSWHPALWQNRMLHVFPSNDQKFGDTFFVHVESFLETASKIKILEYYSPLNFVETKVPRIDPPQVQIETDSIVDAIWKHEFAEPVVQFYKHKPVEPVTISLWQERLRTVVPLVAGSESVLVPKDAKNYIQTQVYDYEWIDKKHIPLPAEPQDIVFISYDEIEAEKNYQTLLELTKDLPNQVHRITGVEGMQNALKAACTIATTPWSYHVFAKTEVHPDFKFDYTPDYLQIPKHYIFHAHNMSNDLVYGEMGIILYNNKMVIESPAYEKLGLDFTMSFPTETVPELSCYGRFATSPYQAWRTAFRETSKIAYFNNENPTMESKHRLHVWTTKAHGDYSEWVLKGANDGLKHFEKIGPQLDKLKSTINNWNWLRDYYERKYSSNESIT
jgi:hypothetical protein